MKVSVFQKTICFGILILFSHSCKEESKPVDTLVQEELVLAKTPSFNEDSAFRFIEAQVAFGPRVPNSGGHALTKDWLIAFLEKHTDEVIVQNADLVAFDGTVLKASNIIGIINPNASQRIMLSAHWDTRPFADQDDEREREPILGANDGASGVAVLLEIARVLQEYPIDIGVDIILFDAEDYGQPHFSEDPYMPDSYCLGSQYWSKNPHKANYTADFGILLDMVGAPNATFTMEGTSVQHANNEMHKVWKIGHALGYNAYFSYLQTAPITDDHYYVNKITKIPTLDIIQYDKTTASGFGWYWHTHDDNIEAIDKKTLKAVGQTVLQVLYQENTN